jgi:hypothetical protein
MSRQNPTLNTELTCRKLNQIFFDASLDLKAGLDYILPKFLAEKSVAAK